MNKIKGLLFDKDGTLYHYKDTWIVWCQRVLKELSDGDEELADKMAADVGFDWCANEFLPGSLIVGGAADEVNSLWQKRVPHLSADQIEEIAVKHLSDLPQEPVCDLKQFFAGLRDEGFKLGVATNDFEEGARLQLTKSGIFELFDYVVGFDSGYGQKPNAGMVVGFAEKTNLSLGEIAMIGDSTHDLQAGKAAEAGLCVGVLTGPAEAKDIQDHADHVISSIETIRSVLD